jgi:CheY-like chemotaxis protein
MNILVVDDVGFSRYRIGQVLTQAGHVVKTAASGPEALQLLRQDTQIELVITDDGMPQMSGLQLFQEASRIERLDDSGENRAPAFVLVTMPGPNQKAGHTDAVAAKHACDLGFTAVLVRPISFPELLEQIKRIAAGRGRKPAAAATRVAAAEEGAPAPAPVPAPKSAEPAPVRVPPGGVDPSHREIADELRRFAKVLEQQMTPSAVCAAGSP